VVHRRLIFSIHGIRTAGAWQRVVAAELSNNGWTHVAFRYGYFSIWRFLSGRARRAIVEQFHDWYIRQCTLFQPNETSRLINRPSIVAHSFGAYVVGECMLKYSEVKFDKMILCGSILPRNFDWSQLLGRNQVWQVRNEYGLKDVWAQAVGRYVPRSGDSGYSGFELDSPCVTQQRFEYHQHSDYFKLGHCREHWLPFLQQRSLRVSVRNGSEIDTKREFSLVLDRAHEIDGICFGKIQNFVQAGVPRSLFTRWIEINPDIYSFLMSHPGGRCVGYVNAMPVRQDTFRKISNGSLNERDITPDQLVSFRREGPIWLFLNSIAIEPGARRISQGVFQEAAEYLIRSVEQRLLNYWRDFGARVVEVVAVGWTAEGREMCDTLGLKQRAFDRYGNPVYSLTVDEATYRRGHLGGLIFRLRKQYGGA
jgi:hypothetical protein